MLCCYDPKCGLRNFNNIRNLSIHLKLFHNETIVAHYQKHCAFKIPICKFCDKEAKNKKGLIFYKTCGSKICVNLAKKRKHTEETKEKIRKKVCEYIKNKCNGETPWSRKRKGQASYLENWFRDKVILKNELQMKYDIISEYPFYPYFLDFAFLNIHLAVELDGTQHKKSIERDNKRNEFLIKNNWLVYRIPWEKVKYEEEASIFEFITFLKNINNVEPKIYEQKIIRLREVKIIEQNLKKEKKNNEIERLKNLILNSDIDFSKFGWVKKASILLKKRPQKIKFWMTKHMHNFYEIKCKKRIYH
jgi:very-short-patch-repair endonuclease